MVWGSIIDNTALVELAESLGANVVMDDSTLGSRDYFPPVEITEDPLDGLADRYLVALRSPRTFRETVPDGNRRKDYMADLESRFGHLKDYARDWRVNGVVLQVMRYCDIYGYEVPSLKDYLESIGLACIYLEHDYSKGALAQLRTRLQAFLEVIG
jgi:benzoyl-CoA reductase/2-hydroxyglutaryl-CoA dehydratase subunit BcrC/BadD/HgdB